MTPSVCARCGATFTSPGSCPRCGASGHPAPTPLAAQVGALLAQAHRYEADGDLPRALECAREAEALNPSCSTIHTVLAKLYTALGDDAAANRHYRKALDVPAPDEECPAASSAFGGDGVTPLEPEPLASSGWALPVVVGCIVLSALAWLFATWSPSPDRAGTAATNIVRTLPLQPAAPAVPALSPPSRDAAPVRVADAPPPVAPPRSRNLLPSVPRVVAPSRGVQPASVEVVEPAAAPREAPKVIGPPAAGTVPLLPAAPTLADADQAFFENRYERAAAIYERLLASPEHATARTFQRLAQCYRMLGNTDRACAHLEEAIRSYQAILSGDPTNSEAHQELVSCQHILSVLRGE